MAMTLRSGCARLHFLGICGVRDGLDDGTARKNSPSESTSSVDSSSGIVQESSECVLTVESGAYDEDKINTSESADESKKTRTHNCCIEDEECAELYAHRQRKGRGSLEKKRRNYRYATTSCCDGSHANQGCKFSLVSANSEATRG